MNDIKEKEIDFENQLIENKVIDLNLTNKHKFCLKDVEIKTITGESFLTKMWVTNDLMVKTVNKIQQEIFKCEVCGKEFDKRQKMLLHLRFHKS